MKNRIILAIIFLSIIISFFYIKSFYIKKSSLVYTNSSVDLIIIESPIDNESVNSNFTIYGKARGFWYFEASFPVEVYDSNNNLIFQTFAKAQGDWMTEDFVPFVSDINITNYQGAVKVVLKKDNPSGDTKNDANLSFKLVVN